MTKARNGHKELRKSPRWYGRLLQDVVDVLASTGLDPSDLELEVTERVAVDEAEEAFAILGSLRAIGVRVAIDDFGTGYSMLSRLLKFPIDTLKIDRSFVQEISNGVQTSPIMSALVAMAHGLGLEVVAEGVETNEQWAELERLECEQAQGYLFSKPVSADEFGDLLVSERKTTFVRSIA